MNSLERAIETTTQIRDALAAEIAVARDERVIIRNMDVDGLNARATKRAVFNQTTAGLMRTLAVQLKEVGLAFGLAEITIDNLKQQAPALGELISTRLAEVRALAAALHELDNLNRLLGQRALSYIRAHLSILSPKPAAYDRRGANAAETRAFTLTRVL
jgi:hypothetical protein